MLFWERGAQFKPLGWVKQVGQLLDPFSSGLLSARRGLGKSQNFHEESEKVRGRAGVPKGHGFPFLLRTWVLLKPFCFWMLLGQVLAVCQGMRVTRPVAIGTVWSRAGHPHPGVPALPGSPSQ